MSELVHEGRKKRVWHRLAGLLMEQYRKLWYGRGHHFLCSTMRLNKRYGRLGLQVGARELIE